MASSVTSLEHNCRLYSCCWVVCILRLECDWEFSLSFCVCLFFDAIPTCFVSFFEKGEPFDWTGAFEWSERERERSWHTSVRVINGPLENTNSLFHFHWERWRGGGTVWRGKRRWKRLKREKDGWLILMDWVLSLSLLNKNKKKKKQNLFFCIPITAVVRAL